MMLLSYYYGAEMGFLMSDSRVKEALNLAYEREKLLKKLEKLPQFPEGYVDGQYRYLYAKLAYIYYVEKQYAELGRTYFDAHRDDEENAENEQFKVIKEALAEIERMKTEILNLQGAAECPNCGARMPQGASFCSSCGTKMAEPEDFTGEVVDDEKFDE